MKSGCGFYLLMLLLAFAFMCIAPAFEMWIWNAVIVDLFAAPEVGFWQMFGIHWLCTLLFRSAITINRD